MELIFLIGIPIVVVICFIINIVKYVRCPKEMADKKTKLRRAMVISGIIFIVLIAIVIGLISMMMLIITNM